MTNPEWKVPYNPDAVHLPTATLPGERKEDTIQYLLDRWQQGEVSTRDVAQRLGMTYYDFVEFSSQRGCSLVPSGPNEDAIDAYKRAARGGQ